MNPPAAMAKHTAAASAKSKQPSFSGFELREGCCGQFMPAAETHPPARTLLVVRTGASVAELSNAAHFHAIALNQILATHQVRVNNSNIEISARPSHPYLESQPCRGSVSSCPLQSSPGRLRQERSSS